MDRRNWAGNYRFAADRWERPESLPAVQELVAASSRVKPVGTMHSFNSVADSEFGTVVDLSALPSSVQIDTARQQVTVSGGTRYGDIVRQLDAAGLAFANLASLPHISVAGAVATGTHGSGEKNRSLAAAVAGMELVLANGEVRRFTRDADPDVFPGLVVSLGTLGVVTSLTLDAVPAFDMRQRVFQGLKWDDAEQHFDDIQGAAYSVSLFTDWGTDGFHQVWVKEELDREGAIDELVRRLGLVPAQTPLHPAAHLGFSAANCTAQLGVPGQWYDRLPHFRLDHVPSAGAELQSEYFVPRDRAIEAIQALRVVGDLIAPILIVSEIRTVKADDLWLSPASGRDSLAIHFTWRQLPKDVPRVVQVIEEGLEPYEARPHWGKIFGRTRSFELLYPRMADFKQLASYLDPDRKLHNDYDERVLWG
jgi:xylitol oxidase